MNRNDFGLWGIDLSPEDFHRALAAAGVRLWSWPIDRSGEFKDVIAEAFEKGEPIRWFDPLWLSEDLRFDMRPSARDLADAWRETINKYGEPIGARFISGRRGIRLEVSSNDVNKLWHIEQLSRPEVGATSVYGLIRQPQTEVVWDWPLRVGL